MGRIQLHLVLTIKTSQFNNNILYRATFATQVYKPVCTHIPEELPDVTGVLGKLKVE